MEVIQGIISQLPGEKGLSDRIYAGIELFQGIPLFGTTDPELLSRGNIFFLDMIK